MANKTLPNETSVISFIEKVEDVQKKKDSYELLELNKEITGCEPIIWGPSLIGFGTYHYKYESGREGDFFIAGFSPRKTALTLYIMAGFSRYDELLQKLGKFKTGKSCLYVKKLDDIDRIVLRQLITESVKYMRENYPTSK